MRRSVEIEVNASDASVIEPGHDARVAGHELRLNATDATNQAPSGRLARPNRWPAGGAAVLATISAEGWPMRSKLLAGTGRTILGRRTNGT